MKPLQSNGSFKQKPEMTSIINTRLRVFGMPIPNLKQLCSKPISKAWNCGPETHPNWNSESNCNYSPRMIHFHGMIKHILWED